MSYQTEEQQIEQLKDWWNENGTPLLIGAALGLAGFFGWEYYDEQQIKHQATASDQYITLTKKIEAKDSNAQAEIAASIKKDFADTAYAALSAFHLAKLAVEKQDLAAAKAELSWVIDKNIAEDMSGIAKIRLARILLSEGQAQQAIEQLDFQEDSGFYELSSLLKGDAYLSLGQKAEALEAYQIAVAKSQTTANHPSLKLIIDELKAVQVEPVQLPAVEEKQEASSETSSEEANNANNTKEASE